METSGQLNDIGDYELEDKDGAWHRLQGKDGDRPVWSTWFQVPGVETIQ